MKTPLRWLAPFAIALLAFSFARADAGDALSGTRHRVLVSSDIGGTDPDDFQSMVHFLLCADVFDVEGIVSSPYGPGRKQHILEVIAHYERDYANLRAHSARYPTPEFLRSIAKQGALDGHGSQGFGAPTEGSDWIVRCARREDPRPLWVLVWGGIDDLAQALHDAPDILPKLRVYFIGGPNKMWSVNAYDYVEQQHPTLWMIEANSTYRGWFVGGNQAGEWSNNGFVSAHLAGRGALGDYFATHLRGTIKMGDSPSVGYLLHGTPADPTQPGWGGRFVRIWDGRKTVFERLTTAADEVEAFGTVELVLPVAADTPRDATASLLVDNRINVTGAREAGGFRFRFSPRDAKPWPYVVRSSVAALDGRSGAFTAVLPPPEKTQRPSASHPQWWIDDPAPEAREGVHSGAKHVSRWREEWLRDFAIRAERCLAAPKATAGAASLEPPSPAVLQSEFINEGAPYPECHASTIVETAQGQLVAAWFGGTKERNPDVGIWVAQFANGRWQNAVEVANGLQPDGKPRVPTWNPVLFQAPQGGPLFLFYKVGPSPREWWGEVKTSTDGGKTWSAARRLPDGILGPVKNKPIVLADGTWLSGSSTEGNPDGWLLHFELSRDAGATWEKIGPVGKGPGFDAIQPSLLTHKDGALEAVGRTKQGVVFQTWSKDNGRTWSALTAVDLPNPNSGTDALTLADGRQLLVYNHSANRATESKGDRYPLDVALSGDGIHWQRVLTLEREPVVNGYAYPAVIQARDGRVHVTYTFGRKKIKHVVLDPARL